MPNYDVLYGHVLTSVRLKDGAFVCEFLDWTTRAKLRSNMPTGDRLKIQKAALDLLAPSPH